jgi:hypothetical protein
MRLPEDLSNERIAGGASAKRQIVGALDARARRFGEMCDLDGAGERQRFILAIDETELAPVA